jgi:hypothetical protein
MLNGECDGPDPVIGVPVKPASKQVFTGSWLPIGYYKLLHRECVIFLIKELRTLSIKADLVFKSSCVCIIIQFAEKKCILNVIIRRFTSLEAGTC